MSLASVLETFVGSLRELPTTVRKNLDEIRKLDVKCETLGGDAQRKIRQLTSASGGKASTNKDARKKIFDALQSDFARMGEMSDEKIRLAERTYETVDRFIIQLDTETAKFNSSIRRRLAAAPSGSGASAGGGGANARSTSNSLKRKGSSGGRKETAPAVGKRSKGEGSGGRKESLVAMTVASPVPISDMPVDPNEPRYCSCNQVSFGEMVMCDNKDCSIEWFHFQCVGLTSIPKGKWFCSEACKSKASAAATMTAASGPGRKKSASTGKK